MPEDQGGRTDQSQGEQQRVVELSDGRRIPEETVLEWERSGLRQADYTRKTQALAEERRRLQAELEALRSRSQEPPPAEGEGEQTRQQQTEVDAADPLEGLREEVRLAREEARFASLHPGVDVQEVYEFARQRGIPSLEDAFRAMDYESARRRAAEEALRLQRRTRPPVPPSTPASGPGPSPPRKAFRSEAEMIEAAAADLRAGRLKRR